MESAWSVETIYPPRQSDFCSVVSYRRATEQVSVK